MSLDDLEKEFSEDSEVQDLLRRLGEIKDENGRPVWMAVLEEKFISFQQQLAEARGEETPEDNEGVPDEIKDAMLALVEKAGFAAKGHGTVCPGNCAADENSDKHGFEVAEHYDAEEGLVTVTCSAASWSVIGGILLMVGKIFSDGGESAVHMFQIPGIPESWGDMEDGPRKGAETIARFLWAFAQMTREAADVGCDIPR